MANLAVIKLAGSQYLVRPGDKIEVNKLAQEVEASFAPDVLLSTDNDKVLFSEGKVESKVISQKRGKKLLVVKFKAKSRYRRKAGHRQELSVVEIISVNGEKVAAKAEIKDEKVVEAKPVKKVAAKKTTTTKAKKTVKK